MELLTQKGRSVELFITRLSPAIQPLCIRLRNIAKLQTPGAIEFIHADSIRYSLTYAPEHTACFLLPQEDHVRVCFTRPGLLEDPKSLLRQNAEGLAYVDVYSGNEGMYQAIKQLITLAWRNELSLLIKTL